jgi:serine/threonine protein kinase
MDRVARADLGPLKQLGAGGQGVVYSAPEFKATYARSYVYKEYKPATLPSLDVRVLEAMPAYLEALSFAEGQGLVLRAAWPCQLVEAHPGAVSGFLMPTIPDEFFIDMKKSSGTVRVRAEFQHLLNFDGYLFNRGIALTDRLRYQLLKAAAEGLDVLHRNNILVGDYSEKNLLYAFSPPQVYFIDCDSMLLHGRSVSKPVETPGWEVPNNYPDKIGNGAPPTRATDIYKFGLLALRLLAGEQDLRSPDKLPGRVPAPIRRLVRDALAVNPATRPAAQLWIDPLTAATATASDAPPQPDRTSQLPQPTQTHRPGSTQYTPSSTQYSPGPPPTYPRPGSGGPPVAARTSRKWPYVLVAGVAAIWLTVHFANQGNDNTSSAPPSIMSPAYRGTGNASGSDSDQIRQLVQTWTDAFNNRDLATMSSLMCSGSPQLNGTIFVPNDIRGKMSSEVTNINVSGDRGTANIINSWSAAPDGHNAETDIYGRQNGSWKICHTVNY